jgi:ubiquinone/menaquinone biosynthesis C-methylase UbiE
MKNIINFYNTIAKNYSKNFSKPSEHLKDFLKLLPKKGNILDIGCGAGNDSNFIKSKKFTVMGIDTSKEMLRIARNNYPEIKFSLEDMRRIKFKKNKFDGIISSYSIIHIPKNEILKTLKILNIILKNKGFIYISLHLGKPREIFTEDPFGQNKKIFLNIMSLREISFLLESAGFKIFYKNKMKPKKGQLNFTKLFIFAQKIF